jgi:hypothetical protein
MSNYTYHGTQDLIVLPGRSVQTFPSGLVRVDRTYACRKGLESRFRDQLRAGNPLPLDDGTPAIDGLFIFPEPQETVRDDGFAEFRVSAYGRTNTTGEQRQNIQPIVIRGDSFKYADLVVENVLPSATALQNLNAAPNFDVPIVAQSTNGDELVRTIPIPVGATVRINQVIGGGLTLIGFSWIATGGGVIFERQSELYEGLFGVRLYQRAYLFNITNKQLKTSEQRYFGFFSEFSSVYGISGQPALFLFDVANYSVNGVVV